jgi:hypothetical protein
VNNAIKCTIHNITTGFYCLLVSWFYVCVCVHARALMHVCVCGNLVIIYGNSDFTLLCAGKLYEGVLISPKPDQEGNKLQRSNSGFIQRAPNEAQYTS